MLTVPEAARRVHRDPETIRRWIRSGKLTARKVGARQLIEEDDLEGAVNGEVLPLPEGWRETAVGTPMPNVVRAVRRSRSRG